jgi:peptidoglycan/LPS O-acetylase OafA/YrhL
MKGAFRTPAQPMPSIGDLATPGAVAANRTSYRAEIDGLRAFAVIAVIINHFNKQILPSGYLGVDIFFVISGYVITASMFNHRHEDIGAFLFGFYSRRVRRLIPALVACVVLTSLAISLFNPNPGISLRTGFAALFGFSNLYLLSLSTDYFAPVTELNAFTHTWSLGVEEQFYMVYPLLVWFSGVGRSDGASRRLGSAIVVLCVLSLIGFLHSYIASPAAAFFLMPLRFWELGAGVLVFLMKGQYGLFRFVVKGGFSLILLAGMIATLFFPSGEGAKATVLIVVLTMLLIKVVRPEDSVYKLLTLRPILGIGLISYSLYLWHWSVIVIGRWTTGIHPWTFPFQLIAMVLLALASYHWIETPLRRSRWSRSDAGNLGIGIGVSTLAAIFLAGLGLLPSISLYTGRRDRVLRAGQPALINPYRIDGLGGPGWKGTPCVLTENADVGKRIAEEDCSLGSLEKGGRRILVIGNSFAPSFIAAFDDLVRGQESVVTITASWGASTVPEVVNLSPWKLANDDYWKRIVPKQLKKLRTGDTVLLISDLSTFSPSRRDREAEDQLATLRGGLDKLGREVRSRGIQLAILHGNPFAREAECLPDVARTEWFNGFGGPCRFLSRSETLRRRQPLDTMLKELQKSSGLIVIDLIDIFCPGTTCTYETADGTLLYRDSNSHPSVEAARLSGPVIETALDSAEITPPHQTRTP